MLKSERVIPITLSGSNSKSYFSRINPDQIARLEREFAKAKLIHATDLELLAAEMALNEKDVQVYKIIIIFLYEYGYDYI